VNMMKIELSGSKQVTSMDKKVTQGNDSINTDRPVASKRHHHFGTTKASA